MTTPAITTSGHPMQASFAGECASIHALAANPAVVETIKASAARIVEGTIQPDGSADLATLGSSPLATPSLYPFRSRPKAGPGRASTVGPLLLDTLT